MIGKLVSLAGLGALGGYAALNYGTYRAVNDKIEKEQNNFFGKDMEKVEFSPTFNYHQQLQKQMQDKGWNTLKVTGETPTINTPFGNYGGVKIGYDLTKNQNWSYSVGIFNQNLTYSNKN